jgi:deoxyhypusine synthase
LLKNIFKIFINVFMKAVYTIKQAKENKAKSKVITTFSNENRFINKSGYIQNFIERHYRHFNASILKEAAREYKRQIEKGNYMMLTIAGAMSTAEIGTILAQMIREDKVHLICCTGANLEEDIFNLVGNKDYRQISNWRNLSPAEEQNIYDDGYARVTDVCIPEKVIKLVEEMLIKEWEKSDIDGERLFPHEFFYRLIKNGALEKYYQIDPADSWLLAACEKNLPIIVPGWEDSTLGNVFAAGCIKGKIRNPSTVRSGIEYMIWLADYYQKVTTDREIGMFQIGGGIAGDFPICVVPMINIDLKQKAKFWSYFCQVSDSTTSYGSYSGAIPNEKITWGKLSVDTPRFIIESDATIVVPLIFAYVLGW